MSTARTLKKLNELIDVELVLKEYPFADDELKKNLILACEIGNEVRSEIIRSSTHPDCNDYSPEVKTRISESINGVRVTAAYVELVLRIILPYTWVKYFNLDEKIFFYFFKDNPYGNCHEMSLSGKMKCKTKNPNVLVEIYQLLPGDHIFNIFGHDKLGISEYWKLGKKAVVGDFWAGEVYPATAIPYKLKDHTSIRVNDRQENKTVDFNVYTQKVLPLNQKLQLADMLCLNGFRLLLFGTFFASTVINNFLIVPGDQQQLNMSMI